MQITLNSHGTLREGDNLSSTTDTSNFNNSSSSLSSSSSSSSGFESSSSSGNSSDGVVVDAHARSVPSNASANEYSRCVVLNAFPSNLPLLYQAMHDFGVVVLPGIVCVPKPPAISPPSAHLPAAAEAPSTAAAEVNFTKAFEATGSDKTHRCLRLSFVGPEENYLVAAQRLRKMIIFLCAQPVEAS